MHNVIPTRIMIGWIFGGVVSVVCLLGILWWMNRPIIYRVKDSEFCRFIDQMVRLDASTSCLSIREPETRRHLAFTIYRSKALHPTLNLQLSRTVWPAEVADNMLALCYDMDLGDHVDTPQTTRSKKLLTVRIPKGSSARAVELARGAFASVGCSPDTTYEVWFEGRHDPEVMKKLLSGGGAV